MVLDSRPALDDLLASGRGVCAVIMKTCCTDINSSGQVDEDLRNIYGQATWLHNFGKRSPTASSIWDAMRSALPSTAWFLLLLGPLAVIRLLIFGPCLFNLLVKFVTSRMQQFHITMTMLQESGRERHPHPLWVSLPKIH